MLAPNGRNHAGTAQVLWDAAGGKRIAVLEAPMGRADCLAFSPDGRLLAASGRLDMAILLFDPASGKLRRKLEERTNAAYGGIAFHADGRSLASAGPDGLVRLWDVAAGKVRSLLRGHAGMVGKVAFSADGRTIAAGGEGRQPVLLLLWQTPGSPDLASNLRWFAFEDLDLHVRTAPADNLLGIGPGK